MSKTVNGLDIISHAWVGRVCSWRDCVALRCDSGAESALRARVPLRGSAEAGLRVRKHQHGMLLAVERLCAKICIQYPQRGRAF